VHSLFALIVLTQAGEPANPVSGARAAMAARAAQICIYEAGDDRFVCDPIGLSQFTLDVEASTQSGTVDATFRPLPDPIDPVCVAGIDVTVLSPSAVEIDWPRATATANGDLVVLLTDTARAKRAPATRELAEPGVPVHDVLRPHGGKCVMRAAPAPGVPSDVFELRLPLVVDGKATTVVWTRRAEWRGIDERAALEALGPPPDPGPPPPEPAAPKALPTFTIAGGIVGAILAVAVGAYAAVTDAIETTSGSGTAIDAATQGVCCGACALPLCAGPLAGGGFLLDTMAGGDDERARQLYAGWQHRHRERAAYQRRLRELGAP